ncbi:lipopolysaccharide biosynthesis protein [Pontibacter locisalis]|uniref:Lipopolysaccharide biosynthesis protein n=1 Tax=Pontibacter locisalis TaxID=1719035 RepID=A0ABW5IPF2_9BACT
MSRVLQREGIWNNVVSYAGIVVGYVNTVLLFPNYLDEAEVGLTRLLLSISVMYAQFSALGFVNMSVRYFPYFRDKDRKHNGFLFLLLSVPLLGFILTTALFLLFKPAVVDYYINNSPLIIEYYYYLIPLALFTLVFNMFTAYLRSLYKTIVSSFVQDFLLRILTTVLISIYAFDVMDFQTFVLLYIIINSIGTLVLVIYIMWLKQLFLRPSMAVLSVMPIKELFYYGFFTLLGSISATIITTVDQVMISSYSLAANGIYTTAFFMTSAILVPGKSILKIAFPQVADFWKERDMKGMGNLYQNVTMINLIVGLLLFIGIWANIDNLYDFMPETYRSGKYVVLFLAIARLVDLATSLNGAILATSEKYKWDLAFNMVLAGLTIWTNWYFIPRYGIEGAALASMLSLVVMNVARLIFVRFIYKIQPFTWSALWVALIATGTLGASYLLPYIGNPILDIAVRSLFIILMYASLTIGLKIYKPMNEWLKKILKHYTGWNL